MSYRDLELEERASYETEVTEAIRYENYVAVKALIPVLIVVVLIVIRLFGF
jgi:hypothetical protein